jgi:hypothetical protein
LLEQPEEKRPLGGHRHRWGDNIMMDLEVLGWKSMGWVNLVEDRFISWLGEELLVAQEGLCFMELVAWNLYENGRNIFLSNMSWELRFSWPWVWRSSGCHDTVIGTSSSEQPTAHIYPEGRCIRFFCNIGNVPSKNIFPYLRRLKLQYQCYSKP